MQMISPRMLMAIVILSVLYVSAQIFSDITSLRILLLLGLSIDGGTLVYPFTFTLRDVIHKLAGAAVARVLIVTAALINVLMAFLFLVVADLPFDPEVGPQSEFGFVLSPVWRIVIASIIAEVVSEFIDTEIYELWLRRVGLKHQWGRVVASNAISVPLDSLLFVTIAFAGELPTSVVVDIFFANVLFKGVISLVLIPVLYLFKDRSALLKTGEAGAEAA